MLKQKRIHDEKNNNQIKTNTTTKKKKKKKRKKKKEKKRRANCSHPQNTQITVYTKSDSVLPQIIII